jgi:beta-galactosidase
MKRHLYILVCAACLLMNESLRGQQTASNVITIDATAPIPPVENGFLKMGGVSTDGHSIQVNSRYLMLDGKPWLPVMGELHYTRIPEEDWETEILKTKSAGVNIISTYVFWIHHEEIEGQFDWTGRRNLHRFVELCGKHGMYVYLRPGPWAHGEVRNGGFPDWLNRMPNLRTNDPAYLSHVARFFDQIGQQLKGMMWKDGGPIIGVQIENEYPLHGAGRGAEHVLRLKRLAVAAGIDPPLFSVTGWPSLDFPPHDVLPVSGGYPDGFWFGSQTALPPSMNYLFNFNRELGDMGATVPSTDPTGKVDLMHDPYFAAEEAGGMATSYHRRPVLSADDIAALALVGIGSGVNLYGYYMFHGGTNPRGKQTTLQESQVSGYPNDLPQIDYDFQAPIGAFGEIRESYRKTRLLHLFLNAYGSQLAQMPAIGAEPNKERSIEAAAADTSTARVALRTNGKSGFAFVNNYLRQGTMPARHGFQLRIRLPSTEIVMPQHPTEIPSGTYLLWPLNLDIGGARLRYSTAQPLTRIETADGPAFVFFAIPGISAEFSFDAATIQGLEAPGARVVRIGNQWLVDQLSPGLDSTIRVADSSGNHAAILILTRDQAEQCSVVRSGPRKFLALTASDIFQDGARIHLRSTVSPSQAILLFPAAVLSSTITADREAMSLAASGSVTSNQKGLWTQFTVSQPERDFHLAVNPIQNASPGMSMQMGPPVAWRHGSVPVAPEDEFFDKAAKWQIQILPPNRTGDERKDASENNDFASKLPGLSELFLQLQFTGDVAHLQLGKELLDDKFYDGQTWEIGLRTWAGMQSPLTLSVLPIPENAPIYLDELARRLLKEHAGAQLINASVIPQYESVLVLSDAH